MKRAIAAAIIMVGAATGAAAQDQYVSEVRLFAGTYCPVGFVSANGAVLQVQQYQALYALLGNTFGGSSPVSFGVPNLIGRAPVNQGVDSTLGTYTRGQMPGAKSVTLAANQLPAHTHPFMATSGATASNSPSGALLPTFPNATHIYSSTTPAADVTMNSGAVGPNTTVAPVAVATQSPSLVLQWCIATEGLYPQRP